MHHLRRQGLGRQGPCLRLLGAMLVRLVLREGRGVPEPRAPCVEGETRMRWEDEREERRFMSKVQKTPGCWVWIGGGAGDGYGMFIVNRRQWLAHRRAYEAFIGPIPTGMVVMHTCDVRRCVNPEHLRAGTVAENIADKVAKNRHAKGEDNGQARLTASQVREIRGAYVRGRVGYLRLANRYGVTREAIKDIVRRATWAHIPEEPPRALGR